MIAIEPDGAWTIEDLAERVYPGVNRIERKHRVSVIRAVRHAVDDHPNWWLWQSENTGGALILVNQANSHSYALGRLKTDSSNHYRDKRRGIPKHHIASEESLRAQLAPGGKYHGQVEPGGAWDLHVQMYCARRDGDKDLLARLQGDLEVVAWEMCRSFGH